MGKRSAIATTEKEVESLTLPELNRQISILKWRAADQIRQLPYAKLHLNGLFGWKSVVKFYTEFKHLIEHSEVMNLGFQQ